MGCRFTATSRDSSKSSNDAPRVLRSHALFAGFQCNSFESSITQLYIQLRIPCTGPEAQRRVVLPSLRCARRGPHSYLFFARARFSGNFSCLDAVQFHREKGGLMSSSAWGLCRNCKWWQIEPDAKIANETLGLCIDEALQPYQLRVSGNSGCNRYMTGTPARATGSAAAPPTAQPVR